MTYIADLQEKIVFVRRHRHSLANPLKEAQDIVTLWADQTFPVRTDQSMFIKMFQEIGEMAGANKGEEGPEFADVMIMLLDYAARKEIDLLGVVLDKMEVNLGRSWATNQLGILQHVK